MKRLALIMVASLLMAAPIARAGELDAEFGSESKVATPPGVTANPPSASELDDESPDQARCHRRWRRGSLGYGFGYGRGYYGFRYGRGFGYGGWGW